MAYSPVTSGCGPNYKDGDSFEKHMKQAYALKTLRELGVDVNIVDGGPSVADPSGIIKISIGFRDRHNNGVYFYIDDDGRIFKTGTTINGKAYIAPEIESWHGK